MERYRKVYGVYDLTHWDTTIACGNGAKLHCEFKGGAFTANGVVPATCTIDNPIHQALMEGSHMFRSGRVKLVRKYAIAGGMEGFMARRKGQAAREGDAMGEVSVERVADVPVEERKAGEPELVTVKVPDLESAGKRYMMERFKVNHMQLRSPEAVRAQGLKHGVLFEVEG